MEELEEHNSMINTIRNRNDESTDNIDSNIGEKTNTTFSIFLSNNNNALSMVHRSDTCGTAASGRKSDLNIIVFSLGRGYYFTFCYRDEII